jgi:hypothetical protein
MTGAVDRLVRTRLAIVQQIELRMHGPQPAHQTDAADAHESRTPASWFGRISAAAATWWRGHPAHLALELATPLLSRHAARKPLQFLGIAAAAGAAIAIVRPWRLLSATGMLLAIAKSSQWSEVLLSALTAADAPDARAPDEIVRP